MSLPPVRGVSHSSQIHWQQASPTLHPPGQINQNQVTDVEILYVGTTSTTCTVHYVPASVLDPDSMRSVDPYPHSESGSGSRQNMTHKNRKN